MARAATVDALRKRGVAKKTAETLADAGFTLEKLLASTPERVRKFLPAKDADRVLAKVRAAPIEKAPPKAPTRAVPRARPGKPRGARAKEGEAEAPAEEEAPPEIPEKTPAMGKGEQLIYDGLRELGRYLPRAIVQELSKKTHGIKVTRKKLHEVLTKICDRYDLHRIDPNESAGIVSAQSIGEPGTQMSLPHEEKVLVRIEGRLRVVPIGELVDDLMSRHPTTAEGPTEWCDLPERISVEVPSLSEEGRIAWKRVRAASRHRHPRPLLRVRTRLGREVTATANHSFVTRRGGHIVPVPGSDLRPGDRIPVVRRWSVPSASRAVDVAEFLPKDRFWYGSEVAKARSLGDAWRKGQGTEFVVPTGMDALARHIHGRAELAIDNGFVYPQQNHSRARLPETMPLDAPVGWLIGAYLSEGWAARYYVNISNTDERFLGRTRSVADEFGIGYSEYDNNRGFARGHDLHLRSVVLSEFLKTTCGRGSDDKRVPDFVLGAGDACVSAVLRAYFEGDGNVSVERGAIRASSNSEELIDGMLLLLARFGIVSSKGRQGKQFTLWIPRRYASLFRDAIGFESAEKRESLDRLCEEPQRRYTYDALDMISGFGNLLRDLAEKLRIPTRYIHNFTRRQRIGRATLARYIRLFETRATELGIRADADLRRLEALRDEDVVWDEILGIEETAARSRLVYDLSVPGLETFTTAGGVVTHNTMRTFHYAGVAEMNVTLGLPRLIEIVDARRVPSTPIMEIHLRRPCLKCEAWLLPEDRQCPKCGTKIEEEPREAAKESPKDLERIRRIAQEIEMTTLEDIADIETDLVSMQVLVYPDDHRMKVRGVAFPELEERLKKFATTKELKRTQATGSKSLKGFVVETGEASFKKLQKTLEQVKVTKIKGIDGIRRAIIGRSQHRRVVYTEGSNLAKVLELPYVDETRTSTNSIQEIFDVLGVEAARNSIIKEAYDTLQEQGLTVDIRHIMLVSDMMTNDGDVKAIGRHGISGRKSSVLARAAFEITAHHLLHAAITGEVDYLDGVAENVIVGQPVTLGTGAVNLTYKPPAVAK